MYAQMTRMVEDFERGLLTRRQLILQLAGLAGAVSAAQSAHGREGEIDSTFKATEINHVALRVADLGRSAEFYRKHLGLRLTQQSTSSCFLNCGNDFLALFRERGSAGLDHYCYSIEDYDPGSVVERLKAVGLEPQRRSNRVYFKDPDGIEVQVSAPNRRGP